MNLAGITTRSHSAPHESGKVQRFEVLDAEEHMPAESEIRERAERIARWSWWTPFARDI